MPLPPPLIPTRTHSPLPPQPPQPTSVPLAGPRNSGHVRTSSDEFGSFQDGGDPLTTSSSGPDLLSFSPVNELGGLDLLEQAKSRDDTRRHESGVLGDLLQVADDGSIPAFESASTPARATPPSPERRAIRRQSSSSHSRPFDLPREHSGSWGRSSSGSTPRPILSPPRGLSHIMFPASPPRTQSGNEQDPQHHNHLPRQSSYSDEPSSYLSRSNADLFRAETFHHERPADFFSPDLVRRVSMDTGSPHAPPSSAAPYTSLSAKPSPASPTQDPAPQQRNLRQDPASQISFPRSSNPSSSSSTKSQSSPSLSGSQTPLSSFPRAPPGKPAPSPPPHSRPTSSPPSSGVSGSQHAHGGASLPTLLKTASRWTSLLSSSGSPPPPPTGVSSSLTHTTPFHGAFNPSSTTEFYTGAPGFRPVHNGWNQGGWSLPDDDSAGSEPLHLVGRREETVELLTEESAELIRPHLPARQRLAPQWTLIYSLDQHGSSLATLYHLSGKFEDRRPDAGSLLVVRDEQGGVFGGYVNEAFKPRPSHYYGSGECFLFKFHPFREPVSPPPQNGKSSLTPLSGGMELFRWTGRNNYTILSEHDFLSLGGGDGKYGLYLDGRLQSGSSARCPAYDNDVLCANERGKFDIVGVEVWGLAA